MTASELVNIFLRLEMAAKEESSEIAFDSGRAGEDPFCITGVYLDDDGDICLESDERVAKALSPREIADAVGSFDGDRTIYFVSVDTHGERVLYNIKDGGTKDRLDSGLRKIPAARLVEALGGGAGAAGAASQAAGGEQVPGQREPILHFESGTINFTINSVYVDEFGCICLESNEIDELDDYPVAMVAEILAGQEMPVYFYDDDSGDYYGIYPDELRTDAAGDVWIKVR